MPAIKCIVLKSKNRSTRVLNAINFNCFYDLAFKQVFDFSKSFDNILVIILNIFHFLELINSFKGV